MSVKLHEVMSAAQQRFASLAAEVAGYLVLAAADQVSGAPRVTGWDDVALMEDGGVRVLSGAPCDDLQAELALRTLLAQMLLEASSVTPGLLRAGNKPSGAGVDALVRELEAALVPVNRSAARRALSRLHRDVERAKGLGALPPFEPPAVHEHAETAVKAPSPSAPPARASRPELEPSVDLSGMLARPAPAAAPPIAVMEIEWPEESEPALPVEAAADELETVVPIYVELDEVSPEPARMTIADPVPMLPEVPDLDVPPSPSAPFVFTGSDPVTAPQPVVARALERRALGADRDYRTPPLGSCVTELEPPEWPLPMEVSEPVPCVLELAGDDATERMPAVALPSAEPVPSPEPAPVVTTSALVEPSPEPAPVVTTSAFVEPSAEPVPVVRAAPSVEPGLERSADANASLESVGDALATVDPPAAEPSRSASAQRSATPPPASFRSPPMPTPVMPEPGPVVFAARADSPPPPVAEPSPAPVAAPVEPTDSDALGPVAEPSPVPALIAERLTALAFAEDAELEPSPVSPPPVDVYSLPRRPARVPHAPPRYAPVKSDVDELLSGFSVATAGSDQDLCLDLKSLAGVDATRPPPEVELCETPPPVAVAERDDAPLAERERSGRHALTGAVTALLALVGIGLGSLTGRTVDVPAAAAAAAPTPAVTVRVGESLREAPCAAELTVRRLPPQARTRLRAGPEGALVAPSRVVGDEAVFEALPCREGVELTVQLPGRARWLRVPVSGEDLSPSAEEPSLVRHSVTVR